MIDFIKKIIHTLLGTLWVIVFFLVSLFLRLFIHRKGFLLHAARTVWAPIFNRLAGISLQIEGVENLEKINGTAIFFANHQSFLDIPVVFAGIPRNLSFVLKKELKNFPFVGWWAAAAHMVFIDRKNREKSKESLAELAEKIKQGQDIIMFPEGTRSVNGKVAKIKLGGIFLAAQSGVPIVPIAIEGTQYAMPKNSFIFRGYPIKFKIGEPIFLSNDLTQTEADEYRKSIQELLQGMKNSLETK